MRTGDFQAVWWLKLHAPDAGGMFSIPGQGTKLTDATQEPTSCTAQPNKNEKGMRTRPAAGGFSALAWKRAAWPGVGTRWVPTAPLRGRRIWFPST